MLNQDVVIGDIIRSDYHSKNRLARMLNKHPDESWLSAIKWQLSYYTVEVPAKIVKLLKKKSYWTRIRQAVMGERHIDYDMFSWDFQFHLFVTTRECLDIVIPMFKDDKPVFDDLTEFREIAARVASYDDDLYSTPGFEWFKATTEERVKENKKRSDKLAKDHKKFYELLQRHANTIYR